jgi:hypothetical protein
MDRAVVHGCIDRACEETGAALFILEALNPLQSKAKQQFRVRGDQRGFAVGGLGCFADPYSPQLMRFQVIPSLCSGQQTFKQKVRRRFVEVTLK